MSFEVPDLPYEYSALEPYIDEETMRIHHDKHHAAYVANVNKALEGHADLSSLPIEKLISDLESIPEGIRMAVRNNGGGHANHTLFWESFGAGKGGEPTGALGDAVKSVFGSYENFKSSFSDAAMKRFGSGWAWLCVHKGGKVEVCSTPNQDNSLMPGVGCGGDPILGLDVWEHAYYLNYQNKRPDYISAFFNVINWEKVAELYASKK